MIINLKIGDIKIIPFKTDKKQKIIIKFMLDYIAVFLKSTENKTVKMIPFFECHFNNMNNIIIEINEK